MADTTVNLHEAYLSVYKIDQELTLDYLVSEGYAETSEEAMEIYEQLEDEVIAGILDEVRGCGGKVDPENGKYGNGENAGMMLSPKKKAETMARRARLEAPSSGPGRSRHMARAERMERVAKNMREEAEDLGEELTGPRREYAIKKATDIMNAANAMGTRNPRRGPKRDIGTKMNRRAAALTKVAANTIGPGWKNQPTKLGGGGLKGQPKNMDYGVDYSRSQKSDKKLIQSKLLKRAKKQIKRGQFQEEFDTYDIVLDYLLDEGFADTEDDAVQIMSNMSEEWRESIIEGSTAE